jgi:hypothetical protein
MSVFLRALAGFAAILCLRPGAVWPDTSSQEESWETQFGQQRYMEYMQRGEVVSPQSPLYRTLDLIGDAIAAVANRQYFAPFHFVLLNEQTPNAFSMPGGNVYVTTALLSFLKNRDELAGVICHEVNHDIHHDMYAVFQATQRGRSPHGSALLSKCSFPRGLRTRAELVSMRRTASHSRTTMHSMCMRRAWRQFSMASSQRGERRLHNLVQLVQDPPVQQRRQMLTNPLLRIRALQRIRALRRIRTPQRKPRVPEMMRRLPKTD